MYRKYKLKPVAGHLQPLEFEWDDEIGQVRGESAERIHSLVAQSVADGDIVGNPYPTVYKITDPLRKPAELAAILSTGWQLPADLSSLLPPPPPEPELPTITDENGRQTLIRPLY